MNNDFLKDIISNPWFGFILGIVGIASLLIGFYTLFRGQKYPCSLSYFPYQTVNLFRNLSIPFPELKITYANHEINKNLMYLSGFLTSDGYRDITNNSEPISFILDPGYKWLDFRASSTIENLNNDLAIDFQDNKAELLFSKLKRGEMIYIQSIIESDQDANATHDNISFTHRIDNTEHKIKKRSNIMTQSLYSFNIFAIMLSYILAMCFIVLPFVLIFDMISSTQNFVFSQVPMMVISICLGFFLIALILFREAKRSLLLRKFKKINQQ